MRFMRDLCIITPSEIVVDDFSAVMFIELKIRKYLMQSLKVVNGVLLRLALDCESVKRHQSEMSYFLDDLVPVRTAAVNRP